MASPTTDRRLGLNGNVAIKAPVACATSANIALSGEQTIGGFLTSGSRVLVRSQTDPKQNGIYDSSSAGWTRSLDANGNNDLVKGSLVYVTDGSYSGNTFLLASSNPVTVDSSALTWTALGVPDTTNIEKNLIDHFGCVPYDIDPTFDNTTLIQAAIDAQYPVRINPRKFRVTGRLKWKIGSKLIGSGNWSGVSSLESTTGTSMIFYDGVDGLDAVCVLSTEEVGITSSTNLQNIALTCVVIDCNGKAKMGWYGVRCMANNQLDFVTVTNSKERAFLALNCFNGDIRCWMAFKNLGSGIILGENVYSWATSNVDECAFHSFFGYFSGYDKSTVAQNTFDDTANTEDSIGIGMYDGRGVVFINAQAADCGGPGLLFNNRFSTVSVIGGYVENNCLSTGNVSGLNYNIWVIGTSSEWNLEFNGVYQGITPAIRLAGVAPSRIEDGVVFRRINNLGTIKADWSNYRLFDCQRSPTIIGSAPTWFEHQRNGSARSLSFTGTADLDATSHAVSTSSKHEGVISGLTYNSSGNVSVPLSETYSGAHYKIGISPGSTSFIHWTNKTSTGFELRCYTGGVLSDTGFKADITVVGDYST